MIQLPPSARLFIYGDHHKATAPLIDFLRNSPFNAVIIMVGDYNVSEIDDLIELNSILSNHQRHAYLIRGNHDNPIYWQDPDMRELVNTELSHCTLLDEVSCFDWNGSKILTVSGATSVDRTGKRQFWNRCWPMTEGIPHDCHHQAAKLVQQHGTFDYFISHSSSAEGCPFQGSSEFIENFAVNDPNLLDDLRKEQELLTKVLLMSEAKKSIFGHFHTSNTKVSYGVEHVCLNIGESIELN